MELEANGEGTILDPYIIEEEGNFLWLMSKHLEDYSWANNKRFEQTSNLNFEGYNYSPIGTEDSPFSTNYDGKGFTISNINIATGDDNRAVGLFGYVKDAVISNIILKDIKINIEEEVEDISVGAIAGKLESSEITNCAVMGNSEIKAYGATDDNGQVYAGGIVGYAKASSIDRVYTTVNVYTYARATGGLTATSGGIVGYLSDHLGASSISNALNTSEHIEAHCLNEEYPSGEALYAGGLVGSIYASDSNVIIKNSLVLKSEGAIITSSGNYDDTLAGSSYAVVYEHNYFNYESTNGSAGIYSSFYDIITDNNL